MSQHSRRMMELAREMDILSFPLKKMKIQRILSMNHFSKMSLI